MNQASLVKITSFKRIGEDERGITAEYSLPRKQDQFIYITRKKGATAGNTYHEGKNTATNPKIFVLLQGKIRFSYRKIGETESYSEVVEAPATITIQPRVTHKVEVLEDMIVLECNAIADIENDRIKEPV